MTKERRFGSMFLAAALCAAFVPAAVAGPPLICFSFDIGSAKSLPWAGGPGERSWNDPDTGYDTRRLADDTLAILGDGTPVLVRMETLRRAAIYAVRDDAAGKLVLKRLEARAGAGNDQASAPLRLFDYGYFIATMKQAITLKEGKRSSVDVAALDGYALVRKALDSRGGDPQMQFAACLVSSFPQRPEHREHLEKALAAATEDSLLGRNLVNHFAHRGHNLDEVRASFQAKTKN